MGNASHSGALQRGLEGLELLAPWDDIQRAEALKAHRGTRLSFEGKAQALQFLRRFLHDPFHMAYFRRLLARAAGGVRPAAQDDLELLEVMAGWLVSGRLRALQRPVLVMPQTAPQPRQPKEAVRFGPELEPQAPQKPQRAPLPESSWPDPAQQFQALAQAAEEGTPFCEECMKQGKPEPLASPQPDPSSQVEALKDASAGGAPFCEECQSEEEPGPDPTPQPDAAAQAETLKNASAAGSPFCEECQQGGGASGSLRSSMNR